MLARGLGALAAAQAAGDAVACFTVYTLESVRAVCDAAAALKAPVMMSAGSSSAGAVGRDLLAAAALAGAHAADADIGVHLDHSTDLDEIAACLALGYSSVMVDGSALPFEDNVRLTREAVELAHGAGAWAEGELGGIAGDEDASVKVRAGQLTDPVQAVEYVRRTGVDALAVAVGTVHGMSSLPAHIDFTRLVALRDAVDVPLVLHGASGLADQELSRAVAGGISKVNFNAELRRAYLDAARAAPGDDVRSFQQEAIRAVQKVAEQKLRVLTTSATWHDGP